MYEIKIKNIFYCCFVLLFFVFITGCSTNQTITGNDILEHQQRVSELERTVDSLTSRLGQYDTLIERTVGRLEVVRGRAEFITNSVQRLEYLFGEYQSIVFDLLDELERIQSETIREPEVE